MTRLFSRLFDRVLVWSRHPRATWYLGALSFAESSFFPVPPDVLLAPMVLARPQQAWRLAAVTTVTSVVGGLAGFAIGMLAMSAVTPLLVQFGYMDEFQRAQQWFVEWGFWAILAAGFSPIPYKVFTIAAGAMSMSLFPFTAASLVGRGARFFMVAALVAWGGSRFEQNLRRHIDTIGWVVVVIIVIAYFALRS